MSEVIVLLFVFVGLGLASHRLGRFTYVAMGLAILTYVSLAYLLNAFTKG